MARNGMVEPAAALGADGRCCGRKPLTYKTGRVTTNGIPQRFCTRCSRSYSLETGGQIANWAWLTTPGGFLPRYPNPAPSPTPHTRPDDQSGEEGP